MNEVSIVRFFGNDIPNIHGSLQSFKNLQYILQNEENFSFCKKIFIINRIVDKNIEKMMIDEIKRYNFEYFVIPFKFNDFIKIFNEEKKYFYDEIESNPNNTEKFLKSINYLTNTNNARNKGIDLGFLYSKTVLILDGSCFLTKDLYFDFINKNKNIKKDEQAIFIFPMYRASNYEEINKSFKHIFWFEPQIGMKNIKLKFDLNKVWPDDKVELLLRYKIQGYWDEWKNNDQKYKKNNLLKIYCKGVIRLPSNTNFDFKNNTLVPEKHLIRRAGLLSLLKYALTKYE